MVHKGLRSNCTTIRDRRLKKERKITVSGDKHQVFLKCREKELQSSPSSGCLFLQSSSHWAPVAPTQITCKCNLCHQVGHISCPPASQDICMWRLHCYTNEKEKDGDSRRELGECVHPKEIHIHQFGLKSSWDTRNCRIHTGEECFSQWRQGWCIHQTVLPEKCSLFCKDWLADFMSLCFHWQTRLPLPSLALQWLLIEWINTVHVNSLTQDWLIGCKEIKGQVTPSIKLALEKAALSSRTTSQTAPEENGFLKTSKRNISLWH